MTFGSSSDYRTIDYRKIFESVPALFLVLGADETFPILDASDAYLRATYTCRDAIVGQPLFEVFPDNPADPAATGIANLRASLRRVLANAQPDTMAVQKYDIRRPASEGGGFEERFWSPINAPALGADGQVLYIVHRVEDVTEVSRATRSRADDSETMRLEILSRGQELQEANRQLREATEQFQAMYDQGLFAARLRLDGTVADINRSAVEVCGFDRADILDRPFWECGWWNRSPDVMAWVRRAVEQAVAGETFRGKSRYFWGDGSEHVVDFACMPIRDAAGRVVAVLPTGMDITEQAQVEENQRALEAERGRAEALAEVDRAKTLFFANVSHEFRTPLSLIIGPMSDALEKGEALEGAQLDLVHRNSLRLLKLVNSLLDFSRIEAGRVRADFAATDLSRLTAELASNFRSACERAGLQLRVDCAPLPEPVHVDHDMWEKIVLNLISNAFKFTFAGGIEISLRPVDAAAELSVRDSGIGIPAPEIGRLFDRFYRIEGQNGRTHEGTGIGLALVQELVKLHSGAIDVESKVGRGTVFTVRVPFGTAHLPAGIAIAAPRPPSASARADAFVWEALRWLPDEPRASSGSLDEHSEAESSAGLRSGGRVLLADDNADMRDYICRLLERRCEVRSVANGREALQDIREHRPDLVISDVMMPDMDGFELLRQIRGDPALRDIPVILLSARAGEESRVEGLAAGADDYLIKPFSSRELIARVGANLDLGRLRSESSAALRDLNKSLEQRVEERTAERDRMWTISPDLMVEARLDGTYQRANPAWQAILGYDPSEVVGRTAAEFAHPDDMARMFEALATVQAERLPSVDLRFRHKDGSYRWIQWVAAPSSGLIFAIGRDIQAAKEAEALLRRTEDQLQQAQKMEAVGQLTGGLAHDFNNLLAGITGSLELIGRRLSQDRLQDVPKYIDAAQDAARRAAALTHRLLAFSRRQTLDPRPTDVNALVDGMAELIRRSVGPENALDIVAEPDLWTVLVDPSQLESALLNLCINSRDAMPGGGRIRIETSNKSLDRKTAAAHEVPAGDYIILDVTDTGTGMTSDVLAHAFDPFFTTKPLGQGTGLGLSMIYGFAKQSGGQVRLKSQVGAGTSVCLYLPRLLSGIPEKPVDIHAARSPRKRADETVLVVDDEPSVRMLVADMLEELGYTVLQAFDSLSGLQALRSDARIDLLISDVGLPGGLNGRQMAEAGRQIRPDLKVLFITGYAEASVLGAGGLGPDMCILTKPFQAETLSVCLRELLGP